LQSLDGKVTKMLSGKLLIWILLWIILQLNIKLFVCIFSKIFMVACFFLLRLRQRSIERALDLTDSFTWEDLPTRDAHTGHLTAAGWIARIKIVSTRMYIVFTSFHFTQSTIRIFTNHETMFNAWYPFDWTASPFYELVNISQVFLYYS
jgi:hypothetical protein